MTGGRFLFLICCWRTPVQEPALEDAVAITWRWRIGSEADILVNATEQWRSYRGPKCDITQCFSEHDLRRVLLHEMGHIIGLPTKMMSQARWRPGFRISIR